MTITRQTVSTGNQWESKYGYARINRCNQTVFVGGTVALNPDGSPCTQSDPGAQTTRCYEFIESSLAQIGLDRYAIM